MDNTQRRTKRLCVNVSLKAWNALQAHSLLVDRHAMNVAQGLVEEILLSLQPDANIATGESPSVSHSGEVES